SGAFQLSNDKNEQYGFYYKKIYHNIVVPTLIWSVVYVIFRITYALFLCSIGYQIYENSIFTMPFIEWAKGSPYYHMWYLYMALGLFLLTPVIIRAGRGFTQKQVGWIGIGFMILGMVVTETSSLFWVVKGIQYIGYYILGYWIYGNREKLKTKKVVFAVGGILSWLCIFTFTQYLKHLYFYGFLSIFVVLGSLCIFAFFACWTYKKEGIQRISQYSFSIYLSHALILALLMDLFKFLNIEPCVGLYIPMMTLLVFFLALCLSKGISMVNKKFAK
ncbi:MAG: acyltransferase family protein, partial [Anaerovorax sp.]